MLENYTEQVVREVLKEYQSKNPVCDCDHCVDDVVATVLNQMHPRYFLSTAPQSQRVAYVLDKKQRFDALIKISEAVPLVMAQNHPEK